MANQLTQYQVTLTGASYVDSTTRVSQNQYPDRVPDFISVLQSGLFNLFNCPIGARGRTFEPEYGSLWYHFIHEWQDDTTSNQMKIAMVQAIQRWEPRVIVLMPYTSIVRKPQLPGFAVSIALQDNITGQRGTFDFEVRSNA